MRFIERDAIKRTSCYVLRRIRVGAAVRGRTGGIVLACIAAALFAAITSALAETRVALVIGNSNYANVPVLANPANDADLVAASLRRVGFSDVTELKSLDQASLKAALQSFAGRARGVDVAIVYYAGHGMEMGGVNYLIPVDAKLQTDTDLQFEAVPLDLALAAASGARQLRLVVMDACRNNPFAVHMRSTGARRAVTRGLAPIEPEGNTLVFYSAKDGTTAEDGSGADSPFATAFAQDIETPGLEIGKLVRRVRDDVLASTAHEQEPFLYGSLSSEDFYFLPPTGPALATLLSRTAPGSAPAIDPHADERAYWQSVSNSNDAGQIQSYLDQYPKGMFAAAARAKIVALYKREPTAPMLQTPAVATDQRAVELAYWDAIKDSKDKSDYDAYLAQYPKGSFANLAKSRSTQLSNPQVASLSPAQQRSPSGNSQVPIASRTDDEIKKILIGRWAIPGYGDRPGWMSITDVQNGKLVVTGNFPGGIGGATIESGEIDGDRISLTASAFLATVHYEGKLLSNTHMEGQFTCPNCGTVAWHADKEAP